MVITKYLEQKFSIYDESAYKFLNSIFVFFHTINKKNHNKITNIFQNIIPPYMYVQYGSMGNLHKLFITFYRVDDKHTCLLTLLYSLLSQFQLANDMR